MVSIRRRTGTLLLAVVPNLFWLLILQASFAMAQMVQGVAVDSVTGRGIPNVKIDLVSGGERYYSVTTDANGRFVFDHVENGVYRAMYSGSDYSGGTGGSRPSQFQVTTGANPVNLGTVQLTPLGAISGRVVDAEGSPVPGAAVSAAGLNPQ